LMKTAALARACGSANGNEKAVSPGRAGRRPRPLRGRSDTVGDRGHFDEPSRSLSTTRSIRSKLACGVELVTSCKTLPQGEPDDVLARSWASCRAAIRSREVGRMEIKVGCDGLKMLKRGSPNGLWRRIYRPKADLRLANAVADIGLYFFRTSTFILVALNGGGGGVSIKVHSREGRAGSRIIRMRQSGKHRRHRQQRPR
jgi:hypothetical protein